MAGDIEVQDLSAFVAQDKKTVEYSERHRRYSEKIQRRDGFAVILQEREPLLGRLRVPCATPAPRAVVDGSRIASLRSKGHSWRDIGKAIGISAATALQAARSR